MCFNTLINNVKKINLQNLGKEINENVIGTFHYMDPKLKETKLVGQCFYDPFLLDIYALGIIFHKFFEFILFPSKFFERKSQMENFIKSMKSPDTFSRPSLEEIQKNIEEFKKTFPPKESQNDMNIGNEIIA